MNQNNNPSYGYDYRNSYSPVQGRVGDTLANQNVNSFHQSQQPNTSNATLLPYHEYMAMQKQTNTPVLNTPVPTPNVYPSNSQGYSQNRQSYPQPYYKGQNPGYQMPMPYPGQYNQYYPYQQLTHNYYGQPVQNPYMGQPTSTNHNLGSQIQNNDNVAAVIGLSNSVQQERSEVKTIPYSNDNSLNISSPVKNATNTLQSSDKKPRVDYQSSNKKENDTYTQRNPQNYKKQTNNFESKRPNYTNQNNRTMHQQQADDYNIMSSNDDWSEEDEEQEMIYQKYQARKNNYYSKSKQIIKKKDPILDDPEEIRKWLEARKKNYPGLRKKILQQINTTVQQNAARQAEKELMSKLEAKIRKKLIIVNGDSRSMMKKIKNIEILRRIIQDPKILKRQRKPKYADYKQKLIEQIPQKTQIKEQKPIMQQLKETELNFQKQLPKLKVRVQQQVSQSQESIQPEQAPANKIPREQIIGQLIEDEKSASIKKVQQLPALFEFIEKEQLPIKTEKKPYDQRPYRREAKILDPETIIAHLKEKQQEDRESLNSLFDYKSNSHSYNYRVQTLQTSLKLDQIFAQTTYLLQAVRYIVKENFFDAKDEVKK